MMRNLKKKRALAAWVQHYRELRLRRVEQDAREQAAAVSKAAQAHEDAKNLTQSTRALCISQAAPGEVLDPLLMRLWYAELGRCEAKEKNAQAEFKDAEAGMQEVRQHWQIAQGAHDRATDNLVQISQQYARTLDQVRLTEAEDFFACRAIAS